MNKNILNYASALLVGGALLLTSCSKDETAPVITLLGDAEQTVALNSSLTDPSATADDEKDGDVTASLTSDYATAVNKDSAGTYTVTYTATDAKTNVATTTRTVIVKNDAETFFASTYNGSETDANGPYTYAGNTDPDKVVTITASKSKNNRVWMTRLGDYANNKVYFDVTGTNIDLPSQSVASIGTGTATCDVATHTFSGTGSKTSTGFTLNYNDAKVAPCSGTRTAVVATFVKK